MKNIVPSGSLFLLLIQCSVLPAGAIRSYQPTYDFEAVKEIAMQGAHFLLSRPENIDDRISVILKDIKKYEKYTRVLCDSQDTIVGFITYFGTTYHDGFIYFVAVRQDMRGKGYGSQLLRHAIDNLLSRKLTPIELTCLTTNPAKKQYERIGFEFDESVVFENKYKGTLNPQRYDQRCKELSLA